MLTSLRVTGFRNLSSLSLEGLTRINLLVGENNTGKTSVLEALEILLLSRTQSLALANGPIRRGETLPPRLDEERGSRDRDAVDLGQLLHQGEIEPGSRFQLSAEASSGPLSFSCTVVQSEPEREREFPMGLLPERSPLNLLCVAEPGARTVRVPLEISASDVDRIAEWSSSSGPSRSARRLTNSISPRTQGPKSEGLALQFIATTSPRIDSFGALWDGLVLTPEEKKVIEALQIIQPDIERLAWLSQSSRGPGGMFVKLQDSDRRSPLGSMGEGIKRLLVLAMNLVKSAGGSLLIDEIDTGLHYTVMVKMWKLVVETARRLEVQVFATSHSLDCIQALAGLYESDPTVRDDLSIHRIETAREHALRYSAEELLAAARRHIDVR
jgi:hypothetical protein